MNAVIAKPTTKSQTATRNEGKLKGIELSLFSYQIDPVRYHRIFSEVCGTHFHYRITIQHDSSLRVLVAPHDHCLVEGGMMYTSAGYIMATLHERGFLIRGYQTIEE